MRRKAADEVLMMIMNSDESRPVRVTGDVNRYVESMRRAIADAEEAVFLDGASVIERGVIWCPGCDEVLRWTQEQQGKELDEDAIEHLRQRHGFTGSTTLREPA